MLTRVKGCGDDDVTPLLQLFPQKDAARVDVDRPCDLLLSCVHSVFSVQLHLVVGKRLNEDRNITWTDKIPFLFIFSFISYSIRFSLLYNMTGRCEGL